MADRVGQRLGNYQLIRLLGEGGFAEVYLGEHIHLGTQAAIKVLYTQLISDDVGKFRTEARTIARLIHPHIVRVLDFGVEEKTPFLVMDYAPNGTLRQRHPKGTLLPLDTILDYVKQVAEALQYAHDEKLIHRDIKPENMLLGRRNEILLSDFGIALVAQSSRYQSAQKMAGTMAYMAPEQIQGHPRTASDQYSLGIVVYEWLSGDRPFHGSLTELVGQHLTVPPPSFQEKVPTISPLIEQVVLKALAKDPKQRFASVSEFAIALEQACQVALSHPVTPTSETAMSSQSLPPTENIAAISPSQLSRPTEAPTPQNQSLQSTTVVSPQSQSRQLRDIPIPPDQASRPTVVVTPTGAPAVSTPSVREPVPFASQPPKRRLSRRTVVVGLAGITGLVMVGSVVTWLAHPQKPQKTSPMSSTTSTSHHSTSLSQGTLLYTYTGHGNSWVVSIAWSPDSKRIASGSFDGTVQVWDAVNGGNVFTYRGHKGYVSAVAWSPDGTRIASGGGDQTVQVWDATTGNPIFTFQGFLKDNNGGVDSIAWSPDSKRIASGSSSKVVKVWDAADGGHVYIYFNHFAAVFSVEWSPDGQRIASGGNDNRVQIWDAADGGHSFIYRGHSASVNAVAWSPDGTRIASGSTDQTVQVWDAADGGHVYIYRGPFIEMHAVAWSPDGKHIAAGCIDVSTFASGALQVWNAADGSNVVTYGDHSKAVNAVAWSHDSKRIASGSLNGTVQVWQAV